MSRTKSVSEMANLELPDILRNKWLWAAIVSIAIIIEAGYAYRNALSVDIATVALIVAMAAVVSAPLVSYYDATTLELKRRTLELVVKSDALRDALYNEIGDIVHAFHEIFSEDFSLRITQPSLSAETSLILLRQMNTKVEALMRLDVYVSTRREPSLFYTLDEEARKLDRFYRTIKSGISNLALEIKLAEQYVAQPATQRDEQMESAMTKHFLQTFEKTFLKKALLYLDDKSIDYLSKRFIDSDDREYFDRFVEDK